MKRLIPVIAAVVIVLVSCKERHDTGERVLSVSIEPQRYLLERIAGDSWTVNTVLSSGEDPENFDPPMSALRQMHDSQAFFTTGTMAFEQQLVRRAESDINVVDTSEGIRRLHGTHTSCNHYHNDDEGHSHEGHNHESDEDPHVWTSITNLRQMARNMTEAMECLDPAGAATYRQNFNKLDHDLDSMDRVIAGRLQASAGRSFMVWHPSLSYFAHDYNLKQISVGMEGREMSVSGFRDRLDHAREAGAGVFLIQPSFDTARSQAIADEVGGIKSEVINSMAYDLPAELVRVANVISEQNR